MLKSLEEHNQSVFAAATFNLSVKRDIPNGLACPTCGLELADVNPALQLPGIPPQLEVYCPSCKFHGFRYV